MTTTTDQDMSDARRRALAVRRPRAVLDVERERSLTARQREVLDHLGIIMTAEGFATLTMADLASRLNCSLRTLYGLAGSRDELAMTVLDRHLQRVGQAALDAIIPELSALGAIRAFLSTATVAVADTTRAFAGDLANLPAGQRLSDDHSDFAVAVSEALLDLAVERGEVVDVDTGAVARVMAGLGRAFTRPDVIPQLRASPKAAADEVTDLILRGLGNGHATS